MCLCECMYACVKFRRKESIFLLRFFSYRPTLVVTRSVCIYRNNFPRGKLYRTYRIVVSRHPGSFFKLKKTSVVQFQNKRLSNILSFFRFSLGLSICVSVLLLSTLTYFFLLFVCVIYLSLTLVACMCVKSALYYYYSTLYHHSQHHSVKVLAFWQNIKTKKIFFRSTPSLPVSHSLFLECSPFWILFYDGWKFEER